MGSQGQEQYVTVCESVCVRMYVSVLSREKIYAAYSWALIFKQQTNRQRHVASASHGRQHKGEESVAGGCLSLSLTLSPLTHASQSQKFAGTLNFEVSALLRRHWESENVSFQWESGRERERAIWVFFLHLLWFLLSLSLSSPHNLWRLKMNTFRCVCFSLFLLTCTY